MDLTVRLANDQSVGAFVSYGIPETYPYASDRHHTFMMEGVPEFRRTTRERGLGFCFYNPNHRKLDVLPEWAYSTLKEHENDPRQSLYSWETLAEARTVGAAASA